MTRGIVLTAVLAIGCCHPKPAPEPIFVVPPPKPALPGTIDQVPVPLETQWLAGLMVKTPNDCGRIAPLPSSFFLKGAHGRS